MRARVLNESERRALAEMDAQLRASDPDLARALSPCPVPRRPRPYALWISLLALLMAPWVTFFDGWPLVVAVTLTLGLLTWGVWLYLRLR